MRESWDSYFMNLAKQIATRSTCSRLHVGCIIVRDKVILSTGYNGSLKDTEHCDDVGHDIDELNHCVRTVHAEANAVAQAAKNGVVLDRSIAYITHSPCLTCFKLLVSAGVKIVCYQNPYRIDRIDNYAMKAGIVLMEIKEEINA
jgi:dCMP deaminase